MNIYRDMRILEKKLYLLPKHQRLQLHGEQVIDIHIWPPGPIISSLRELPHEGSKTIPRTMLARPWFYDPLTTITLTFFSLPKGQTDNSGMEYVLV